MYGNPRSSCVPTVCRVTASGNPAVLVWNLACDPDAHLVFLWLSGSWRAVQHCPLPSGIRQASMKAGVFRARRASWKRLARCATAHRGVDRVHLRPWGPWPFNAVPNCWISPAYRGCQQDRLRDLQWQVIWRGFCMFTCTLSGSLPAVNQPATTHATNPRVAVQGSLAMEYRSLDAYRSLNAYRGRGSCVPLAMQIQVRRPTIV